MSFFKESFFAPTFRARLIFGKLRDIQGFRACLHGGGEPQVGKVTRLGKVQSFKTYMFRF